MIFGNKIGLLHEMAEKKLVSSLAINIAEFLCGLEKNLSEEEKTALAAVSALLYEWISSGSICLTKDDIKTFIETNGEALSGIGFPNWEKIGSILSKSSCCTSDPEKEQRPVVLDGERIYFYKYWLYETSLAEKVLKLSRLPGKYLERALPIKNAFIKLFKDPQSIEQKNAADKVIENRFSVITGGPGTGKTTTVAKIIAGILSVFPEERIVLAAPTGKAAARMTEALREAIKRMEGQGLAEDPEIFEKMNSLEGKTIHKLLNWMFGRPEKNREDPIYADLIIIDEASMVDITMFSSLLDAISDNTSLVLLGDKDQLASVDAGNVLCDICNAAEAGLFERQIEAKLTKSHRFEEHPSIGRLADAVNGQKDAKEIIRICTEEPDLDFMSKTTAEIVGKAAENYGFLSDKTLKPAEILDKLNNFKILCPSKEDSFGVAKLNEAIERALGRNGSYDFYNGRPIMITKNDYSNNLMNGDCGVILGNRAYFKTDSGVKSFPVSVLPPLETVYAMTIHKSQGSEYDSVLVVMPENNMPMLTKELLYTAITRAKERVAITAQESVLEYTLKRSAARNSGFVNALKKLKKSDEK